jgi:hypothetical protein
MDNKTRLRKDFIRGSFKKRSFSYFETGHG